MDNKVLIKKLSEFKKAINFLKEMDDFITIETLQKQGEHATHLIDSYCRRGMQILLDVQCILVKNTKTKKEGENG